MSAMLAKQPADFTDTLYQFNRDVKNHFSENTMDTYNRAITAFFTFNGNLIEAVTNDDIESWVDQLTEGGLKPASIMVKIAALKMFFNYCIEEGLIVKDPAKHVECPKVPESLPKYFSNKTMFLFREETKRNPRDRAIMETLYCTGLRVSELISVLLEEISWELRQIWVRNGKGAREGYVYFTVDCMYYLQKYLEQRQDNSTYLFVSRLNKPFTRQGIWKIIKRYVKRARVEESISPHSFRHSFATNMAEKEAPFEIIQDFLRLKSAKVVGIYARLTKHAQKVKYDRYR